MKFSRLHIFDFSQVHLPLAKETWLHHRGIDYSKRKFILFKNISNCHCSRIDRTTLPSSLFGMIQLNLEFEWGFLGGVLEKKKERDLADFCSWAHWEGHKSSLFSRFLKPAYTRTGCPLYIPEIILLSSLLSSGLRPFWNSLQKTKSFSPLFSDTELQKASYWYSVLGNTISHLGVVI